MGALNKKGSRVVLVTAFALVAAVAGTAVAGCTVRLDEPQDGQPQRRQDKNDSGATTNVSKKLTKKIATKEAKKQDNKQDARNFPIDRSKIRSEAVTSGKLAPGAVQASKLGNINVRKDTIKVISGSQNNTTVDCQAGEQVISGGAKWDALNTERGLQQSYMDGNGWNAAGENKTAATTKLTVYAYCLENN